MHKMDARVSSKGISRSGEQHDLYLRERSRKRFTRLVLTLYSKYATMDTERN